MRALLAVAAALMALFPAAPPHASATRTVEIAIRHSRFVPAVIDAREGEQLRIVVRNEDFIDHEWIVGDDSVHERHEQGTERSHGSVPGEVSAPAWTSVVTTWTVAPGATLFACHLPGHFAYGMQGLITAEA